MILSIETPVTNKDLIEAIQLKCSPCYAAMAMCNALGGSVTVPWTLCHSQTLKTLVDEANTRLVSLDGVECSVEKQPIKETMYYKRAMGLITEDEFQAAFRKWKNGDK